MAELSNWKGSITTARIVASTIAKRYGKEEAKKYDPTKNCFTYQGWIERGYQVKKGEKAIRSITFIKEENVAGEVTKSYPKKVFLFYRKQVKKVH